MSDVLGLIQHNSHFLADALLVTVQLNALSIGLALVLGIGMGVARHYGGRPLYLVLGVVVDVVRAIPILVLMVWMFFALPLLLGVSDFPAFTTAVIVLSLHTGVYISEVVRGGLASVQAGQMQAALALGMTRRQAVQRIILPQALIRMLPAIGSRIVRNMKDSVLASTIAVQELFWAGTVLEGETAKPFPIYTALMIFYFLLIVGVARGIDIAYKRLAPLGAA